MKITTYLCLFVFLLFACKKEKKDIAIDLGYNYFPTDTTLYRIYNIDSIVHQDNDGGLGVVDTFRYQIKEQLTSTFIDKEGRTTYKISRFYRKNSTKKWQIKDVWKTNAEPSYVEILEENVRLMKLTFPITINKTWNGNALNNEQEQEYEYTTVNEPYSNDYLQFDSTVTVLQKESVNIIEEYHEYEIYAKNIGLIHKTKTFIDIQNDSGLEYYMNLSEYGND